MKFFELLYKMPALWPIVAGALLALYFFFEKVMQFHRDEINVPELLRGLGNALKRNALVEALTLCDNTPGPAAKLLGAAILARQNDADLRQAMDEVALVEIPRLEHHVCVIGTIGFVMPFFGLLGTILAMMDAADTAQNASSSFSSLFFALAPSLTITAAALVVAIPCFLAHNYLVARINMITLDMEKAAMEITSIFEKSGK